MKITCAFQADPSGDGMPCLIAAYDEYTEEAWGRVPAFYTDDIKKAGTEAPIREVVIELDDTEIEEAFEIPYVAAHVTELVTPEVSP